MVVLNALNAQGASAIIGNRRGHPLPAPCVSSALASGTWLGHPGAGALLIGSPAMRNGGNGTAGGTASSQRRSGGVVHTAADAHSAPRDQERPSQSQRGEIRCIQSPGQKAVRGLIRGRQSCGWLSRQSHAPSGGAVPVRAHRLHLTSSWPPWRWAKHGIAAW